MSIAGCSESSSVRAVSRPGNAPADRRVSFAGLHPDLQRLIISKLCARGHAIVALVDRERRRIVTDLTVWKQWYLEKKYRTAIQPDLDVSKVFEATARLCERIANCNLISEGNFSELVENNRESMALKFFAHTRTTHPNLLSAASQACPHVQKLSVKADADTEHTWVTDEELEAFTTAHPHLTSLKLEGCLELTEAGILKALNNCKNLRHLSIESRQLTAPVIVNLVSGRIFLESLAVRGERVEGSDILGEIVDKKGHLLALKSISVRMFPCQDSSTPPFTQLEAKYFLSAMGNLKEITLEGCVDLDDRAIEHIAENNGQTLRKLVLHGCSQVTPDCLQVLGKSCMHLSDLVLLDVQDPKPLRKTINQLSKTGLFKAIRHCRIE